MRLQVMATPYRTPAASRRRGDVGLFSRSCGFTWTKRNSRSGGVGRPSPMLRRKLPDFPHSAHDGVREDHLPWTIALSPEHGRVTDRSFFDECWPRAPKRS